ncbi:MAG: phenylalanine--tRNA ligase subunit beta, partial [Myxococcota bacterium]
QCESIAFGRDQAASWGDPAAQLSLTVEGQAAGALAVLSSRTKRKAGIKGAEVALFELDVDMLTPLPSRENQPEPLKKFPQVDFDISVIVAREVEWEAIQAVATEGDALVQGVSFVDEYVGAQVPDGHKSMTLRLCLGSDKGTLVREQIDEASNRVMGALKERLGGVIRD